MDHLGLLLEELVLVLVLNFVSLGHLFVAALESSVYALNHNAAALDLFKLPLDFKHAPAVLNDHSCCTFFLAVFLSFTAREIKFEFVKLT